MKNEKDFIQIINRFIDSITAINQSLGSNRELVSTLIQKIDFQKIDSEKIEKILQKINNDMQYIIEMLHKNDAILDLFKSYVESNLKSNDNDISKEEIQLKIEEIKATKEEKIEEKRYQTVVKSEKWKTIAAILVAVATTIGTVFAVLYKNDIQKEKTNNVKNEELKTTR